MTEVTDGVLCDVRVAPRGGVESTIVGCFVGPGPVGLTAAAAWGWDEVRMCAGRVVLLALVQSPLAASRTAYNAAAF